jgi:hypothetical protein
MAEDMGLKDYKEARLIFVNKDNSYIGLQVVIKLTPELRKKIIDRANYLNRCVKTNTIPDCECEGWKIAFSGYGRPSTRKQSAKKKWGNTECCGLPEEIEQWRKEELAENRKDFQDLENTKGVVGHPNDTKTAVEGL